MAMLWFAFVEMQMNDVIDVNTSNEINRYIRFFLSILFFVCYPNFKNKFSPPLFLVLCYLKVTTQIT